MDNIYQELNNGFNTGKIQNDIEMNNNSNNINNDLKQVNNNKYFTAPSNYPLIIKPQDQILSNNNKSISLPPSRSSSPTTTTTTTNLSPTQLNIHSSINIPTHNTTTTTTTNNNSNGISTSIAAASQPPSLSSSQTSITLSQSSSSSTLSSNTVVSTASGGGGQGQLTDKKCHCKNSKCLKMYCECFANKLLCNGCQCYGCHNNETNIEKVERARSQTLERNPDAFTPKIKQQLNKSTVNTGGDSTTTTTQSTTLIEKHLKGCHCRKSGCQKKYCECFQAGILCNENCKCYECKNKSHNHNQNKNTNNNNNNIESKSLKDIEKNRREIIQNSNPKKLKPNESTTDVNINNQSIIDNNINEENRPTILPIFNNNNNNNIISPTDEIIKNNFSNIKQHQQKQYNYNFIKQENIKNLCIDLLSIVKGIPITNEKVNLTCDEELDQSNNNNGNNNNQNIISNGSETTTDLQQDSVKKETLILNRFSDYLNEIQTYLNLK